MNSDSQNQYHLEPITSFLQESYANKDNPYSFTGKNAFKKFFRFVPGDEIEKELGKVHSYKALRYVVSAFFISC